MSRGPTPANDLPTCGTLDSLPASVRGLAPTGLVAGRPTVVGADPVKMRGGRVVDLAVRLAAIRITLSRVVVAVVEVVASVRHVFLNHAADGLDCKGTSHYQSVCILSACQIDHIVL